MKPWVTQSLLTFYSVDRTLKCDNSVESCWTVLNLVWWCLFFNFTQFVSLENLSILDLALPAGVKGLKQLLTVDI